MLQLGPNTTEQLCVVGWTVLLYCLPRCHRFPAICDAMTDHRLVVGLAAVDGVLIGLSYVVMSTRYGKQVLLRKEDTSLGETHSVQHFVHVVLKHFTFVDILRLLLDMTLPLLGVMVGMHPGWTTTVCLLKKVVMLEGKMWQAWCPESYIIFVSVCCILCIARRSSFRQKVRKHDRFKKQSHPHFYHPSPSDNYGMA